MGSDNPSGLFTRIQVATRYLDILSTDHQIQLQKSAAMKPLDSLIIYTGLSDRKARSYMNVPTQLPGHIRYFFFRCQLIVDAHFTFLVRRFWHVAT